MRAKKKLSEFFSFEAEFIKNYLPEVHDRFAIVDNELWHFGANVGGTHKSVNCFSRGWPAREYGAADFFQDYWKEARA